MKSHAYISHIRWTGNRGAGTTHYHEYDRHWDIAIEGKPIIHCSNDPLLGGDPHKMNPEDLLLSALSACHMLWFLHYASEAGIVVTAYQDSPEAQGEVERGGAGRFINAELKPQIVIRKGDSDMSKVIEKASELHHAIHKVCFIARSVNFPVACSPEYSFEE
ncbi:hypothetical protein LMG33818_002092 [Halomonadaceae bacterium LMG 33818]|uniref:OsmC family protein n=1 Tax=Cernens ardua TaxID=3402176 RepID=UPI003EDBF129